MPKTDMAVGKPRRHLLKGISDTNLLMSITIVVFILMYVFAIFGLGQGFLKAQTFFNMLNAHAALIILACGMTLVMITGGIDISLGGMAALVSMCSAVFLDMHSGSVFGAIMISLGIGLAFGLVQGFLVAYLDIQPFIVTLAGMFFARGMTTIVNTNPFNVQNEAFVKLKETRIIIQCKENYIPCISHVRNLRWNWRICLFYARWFGFSFSRNRR